MLKQKSQHFRQLQFIAPFALRMCQTRLRLKDDRKGSYFSNSRIEVYLDGKSDTAMTFLIGKGAAVARVRLDQLEEDSTLVTLETRVNWFARVWLSLRVLGVWGGVLLGILPILILFSVFGLGLATFLLVAFLSVMETLSPVGLGFIVAFFVFFNWGLGLYDRRSLNRLIEKALTDQLHDPLALIDMEKIEKHDGQLVTAPPLRSMTPTPDEAVELSALLKEKRKR